VVISHERELLDQLQQHPQGLAYPLGRGLGRDLGHGQARLRQVEHAGVQVVARGREHVTVREHHGRVGAPAQLPELGRAAELAGVVGVGDALGRGQGLDPHAGLLVGRAEVVGQLREGLELSLGQDLDLCRAVVTDLRRDVAVLTDPRGVDQLTATAEDAGQLLGAEHGPDRVRRPHGAVPQEPAAAFVTVLQLGRGLGLGLGLVVVLGLGRLDPGRLADDLDHLGGGAHRVTSARSMTSPSSSASR
jgi:hypothetical protein